MRSRAVVSESRHRNSISTFLFSEAHCLGVLTGAVTVAGLDVSAQRLCILTARSGDACRHDLQDRIAKILGTDQSALSCRAPWDKWDRSRAALVTQPSKSNMSWYLDWVVSPLSSRLEIIEVRQSHRWSGRLTYGLFRWYASAAPGKGWRSFEEKLCVGEAVHSVAWILCTWSRIIGCLPPCSAWGSVEPAVASLEVVQRATA